jgi:hypothetical protein
MLIEHGADLTAQKNDGVTSGVNSISLSLGVITLLLYETMQNRSHNDRSWRKCQRKKTINGLALLGQASQGRLAEVTVCAPLSSTVPILVATTAIEPGAKMWICICTRYTSRLIASRCA